MLFGIVMLVRLVQPENALSPIEVTPSGIVILIRLVQARNDLSPIEVIPLGIITLAIAAIKCITIN